MWFSKSEDCFALLGKAAENLLSTAKALDHFILHPGDGHYLQEIKEKEHVGDDLTHRLIEYLNKTFITPIDREDIHELVSNMDNILDYIFGSADRIALYKITRLSDDATGLGKTLIKSVEEVSKVVQALKNIRRPEAIIAGCAEVRRLERQADHIHRKAVADLFANEREPLQVIKMKEILDHLEDATDFCQDVADCIEGIVLKNS